jgi:hypothetical protein
VDFPKSLFLANAKIQHVTGIRNVTSDRQTEADRDRQADRQADRLTETDRQRHTDKNEQTSRDSKLLWECLFKYKKKPINDAAALSVFTSDFCFVKFLFY